MRHRTWSYNEISRRYTEKDIEFYNPILDSLTNDFWIIENANKASHGSYINLIGRGIKKEIARGVLTQNLMTTFVATVDLRNLLHFVELRESEHAQAEIRQYADAIKILVKPFVPTVAEYYGWEV